jgi:hypothetical protein
VSEIDFNEIEKAMAELVNKAQGQKRQSQLKVVTNARNEKAKKIETAHEQGNLATKRIIIAGNRLRSTPAAQRVRTQTPNTNRPSSLISDFNRMPSSDTKQSKINKPEGLEAVDSIPEISQEEKDDLQKTVGDLSNDFLLEKVSQNDQIEVPKLQNSNEEYLEDDSHEYQEPKQETITEESESTRVKDKEQDSVEDSRNSSTTYLENLESVTGPSPSEYSKEVLLEDNVPEAEEYSKEIGKVHKMYGQHLPHEYRPSNLKTDRSSKSSKKGRKHNLAASTTKPKRGMGFYFLVIIFAVACVVWLGAVYLYFFYSN